MRMIAFLLLGSLALDSPASATFKAPFCPDCWKFLKPWDLDFQGKCLASGKKPVVVEAATLNWFWCRPHNAWHRRPCGKDPSVPWMATAFAVPDGFEPGSIEAYCPLDQLMFERGNVGRACRACTRPMAAAETVERSWTWCLTEKSWLSQPCAAHARLHCCSPRSGKVLAHPLQVRMQNEAFAESPNR